MQQHNRRAWFAARSGGIAGGGLGPSAAMLLFCAAAAAVNPLRECPVNDDWAYAATVQRWLETGEYRPNEWIAANPLVQTLWGGLFCRIFGESFTALRLSTIELALVGLAAFRGGRPFDANRDPALCKVDAMCPQPGGRNWVRRRMALKLF